MRARRDTLAGVRNTSPRLLPLCRASQLNCGQLQGSACEATRDSAEVRLVRIDRLIIEALPTSPNNTALRQIPPPLRLCVVDHHLAFVTVPAEQLAQRRVQSAARHNNAIVNPAALRDPRHESKHAPAFIPSALAKSSNARGPWFAMTQHPST
jgi:hypothetical protein